MNIITMLNAPVMPKYTFSEWASNMPNAFRTWGSAIILLIGIVSLIYGVYRAFQGLKAGDQGGHTPVKWPKVFGLILLGGLCMAGGLGFWINVSKDAQTNIDEMTGSQQASGASGLEEDSGLKFGNFK